MGETETRMFQISGVSLHSILADILNTMERPLYKNYYSPVLVTAFNSENTPKINHGILAYDGNALAGKVI